VDELLRQTKRKASNNIAVLMRRFYLEYEPMGYCPKGTKEAAVEGESSIRGRRRATRETRDTRATLGKQALNF
jgi:hypothetical protein